MASEDGYYTSSLFLVQVGLTFIYPLLQVLVCGDLRGNLVLFPLLKSMLLNTAVASEVKICPINYFKGVHGISSVSSVSWFRLSLYQSEICSVWPKFKPIILLELHHDLFLCVFKDFLVFFPYFFLFRLEEMGAYAIWNTIEIGKLWNL